MVTSDNILEMSVNGTFFNANAVKASKFTPTKFPVHDPKGKTLQGYLSQYTPNTLLESAFSTGNTLDFTELLSKLKVVPTTTDFKYVIPELAKKYGEAVPVGIAAKFITKESHITMSAKNNELDANVAFTLTVKGEEAVYAEFNGIKAVGQVSSTSGKVTTIFGALSTSNIGTITASSFKSTISGMTAASLQKEIQGEVDGYVA